MNDFAQHLLIPDWPAPANVRACVTTRAGGVSQAPYDSLNLGDHVGDAAAAEAANRQRLTSHFNIQPAWLSQVHGVNVVPAAPEQVAEADGNWTATPGIACTAMTADCLPALFCDRAGSKVAAAHAGWRGLVNGVLEATVAALDVPPGELLVWLGPAIGPGNFEVGAEVREAFVRRHPQAAEAFAPGAVEGKFLADIYQLARIRLAVVGVTAVYGGGLCTIDDTRFFSYRRANPTGRFASLVWLEA